MSGAGKIKTGAITFGRFVLILLGWCLVMAAYLTTYNQFESNALPVTLGPKDFSAEQWDNGFFHTKGALQNKAAINPGDEMVPGVTNVDCVKSTNTCTISTADVFDGFLNLDVTSYDIDAWSGDVIRFSDSTSICVDAVYVINRVGQTFSIISHKKAVIPDYALKSPLHPCDKIEDRNVTLEDGFQVYWHLRQNYEQRNGIYFHALLVAMNVAYFAAVAWTWRRNRRRKAARLASADV